MAVNSAELAHRWFEEVWNQGREEVIDELSSPDIVAYGLGEANNEVRSPVDFKVFWRNLRTALPDIHITIHDTIVQADKVVVRLSMVGTHQGLGLGVTPSGRRVAISGIVILKERGGLFVEAWNSWDQLGLLQQIGVITGDQPRDRFLNAQV